MKKQKPSGIRNKGLTAGAVCLCLLICMAVFLQNSGMEKGTRPEQRSVVAVGNAADSKEPGGLPWKSPVWKLVGENDINGMKPGGNPEAVWAEEKNSHPQESESAAGMPAGSAAEAESSQVLGLSDIQAMPAGEILDVSGLSEEFLDGLFYSREITEEIRQRIWGGSYQENDNISLSELRYLRVLHIGFDGETHIGELMVNQSIAEDVLEIMEELYRQEYPIEKMLLIDEYGADDESSMSDNNTSAFNYREIAGSAKLSRHALGMAIDINPRYNPYVKHTGDGGLLVSPANGWEYADRDQDFSYKIAEGNLCLELFAQHGFSWGGYWNSVKDYQHFEK